MLGSDIRHRKVQTSLPLQTFVEVPLGSQGLQGMVSWLCASLLSCSPEHFQCFYLLLSKISIAALSTQLFQSFNPVAYGPSQPRCLFPSHLYKSVWLHWQQGLFPSLNLNGIALHASINFCITGVSFPHVKEMLRTINIIIHVTGSEHTFRGASASAMWAALQLRRTKGCVLTILMAARNQCRWNQAYF